MARPFARRSRTTAKKRSARGHFSQEETVQERGGGNVDGDISRGLIGIEACAGAHFWARELARSGVRLMPLSYNQRPFQLTFAQEREVMEAMALGSLAKKFLAVQRASTMAS